MKFLFQRELFRIRKFLASKSFEIARIFNEPILKKEMEENPSILSMAPKVLFDPKDLKLINPYLSQLKKAMLDKDILNIAITGNYGSGKSTVIKTFQYQNPQYNYINISLASFKEQSDNNELEKKLEISILQQIFYHVDPSKIPDSKFKRIKTYGWGKLGLISSVLFLWIYSAYAIINFDLLKWLNPSNWRFNQDFEILTLVFYSIFISGLILIMKDIIRVWSNSKINKINIKGELEIGEKAIKSVFNEHLEEILYFFEKTNFNTVIFEDLDRFENTQIFTKLREINTLLNNFESISNRRKIKFIYAVKDEVLTDKKHRVKFFDLIIPIIPFINQSNASEQLTNLIQKSGLQNSLSPEFKDDIMTFINDIDMRLLINIFLEYNVFKESMSPDLNQDQLFALVTYKNLFPEDFAKLYRNEGDLYQVLTDKNIYLDSLKEKVLKEIESIENQIREIEKEKIDNLENLKRIYFSKIIETYPNITEISLSSLIPIGELLKDEYYNQLVELNEVPYYFTQHYSDTHYRKKRGNLRFSEVENSIFSDKSYNERKEAIRDKDNNLINLRNKIKSLNQSLISFESLSLADIFQEISLEDYLFGDTDNDLVKNLIINGYLNENYQNYISIFHDVSITESDFKFYNTLLTGGKLPFDFRLTKIENLIKKISKKYFSRYSILNFDVLDFLIVESNYLEQRNLVFNYLSSGNENAIKFIHSYINRDKNLDSFINIICNSWEGFWDNINSMNFTIETKDLYFKHIIEFGEVADVIKFNNGTHSLIEFIQDRGNFFELVNNVINKQKVKIILDRLDIKFLKIERQDSLNKWIFDYVYDNNYYEINIHNINILLNNNINNSSIYTSIYNSDLLALLHYVKTNINHFVSKVLLMYSESMQESSVALIDLLNNSDLNLDLKHRIIKKQNGFVEQLSEISNLEVKKLLLKELKVIPEWMNVVDYYNSLENETDLDDILLDYLNNLAVFKKLEDSTISPVSNATNDEVEGLVEKILQSSNLSDESFIALRKSVPFEYAWLDFDKLSEVKVKYAIDSKLIYLDIDGAKKLNETYPELRISLFEKYQNEFFEYFSDLDVSAEEIVQLLDSNEFEFKNKFELIKVMNQSLLIENSKIASRSCDILASSEYYPLSFAQLEFMFKFNLNWESKIEMLITHFKTLDFDEIQSLSKRLTPDGYYSKLFQKQKKPTFDKNAYNEAFFELLESKSFIRSFGISPWDKNKYRVIANY
ncbi:hypothetical protein [Algoriphagus sp. CAU 1675]|uniref:YobI family P-loop NTPase n=1 Tax=Algoriphagus sp. CAU 1675 TaxID=3032597 RepID=UPI0023DA7EEC|nr:hypothetical protein [Algoriphagus sp. CAU 1675]MDF2156482.1 hypothetical protein [Algoriphagus sp. CAU 1675]